MLIKDLFSILIEDMCEEARFEFLSNPRSKLVWLGTIQGLGEIENLLFQNHWIDLIKQLHVQSSDLTLHAMQYDAERVDYWFARETIIDAMADRLSVILYAHHQPLIVYPTKHAVAYVKLLAGIREEQD